MCQVSSAAKPASVSPKTPRPSEKESGKLKLLKFMENHNFEQFFLKQKLKKTFQRRSQITSAHHCPGLPDPMALLEAADAEASAAEEAEEVELWQ